MIKRHSNLMNDFLYKVIKDVFKPNVTREIVIKRTGVSYSVYATDGWNFKNIKFFKNALDAKKYASELIRLHTMINQMQYDIDRGEIRYDDITSDKPFNVFYCSTDYKESQYERFSDTYYKNEWFIELQLEKYFDAKFSA